MPSPKLSSSFTISVGADNFRILDLDMNQSKDYAILWIDIQRIWQEVCSADLLEFPLKITQSTGIYLST